MREAIGRVVTFLGHVFWFFYALVLPVCCVVYMAFLIVASFFEWLAG